MLLQLHKHWKGPDALLSTDADLPATSTAAGILGLGRSRQRVTNSSLEREVNSYLDDMEEGSGALAYWQASNSHSKYQYYSDHPPTGKSFALSYYIRTGDGYFTNTGLISAMRTSFFIC